ncbi:MAG: glycosyltransferase, group 1 [Treponematales bacterium]
MTVVHVLQPFASGVVTAVISIAQQLPEVKHVVAHGTKLPVDDEARVKARFPAGVVFVPWKSAGREISVIDDAKALRELLAILAPYRRAADAVIHLHSSKAGFLGRLACALLGIRRVIYTPHCGAFLRTDISPLKRAFFRFLEWFGARLGGVVVGCGRSEGETYAAFGKSLWVSNGVAITPPRRTARPRFISFSGVASVQKNPALFNAIAAAFPKTPFRWIGDGPLAGLLSATNIEVTGWREKSEVDALLADTLIYLSASSWEGLPFAALEAMNAGCALLLTDVPGNRDIVPVPGENGFLFRGADEGIERLAAMLVDGEKTTAMGTESRRLAERCYSLEAMGQGYRKIYGSMVG